METSEEKHNLYVKSDTYFVVVAGRYGRGNEEEGVGWGIDNGEKFVFDSQIEL